MDSVDSSTRADQTLTLLSTTPDYIDEDVMHTNEKFIILFYDRTSNATDIQGMSQAVCKEKQRPADPTDKSSPGAARLISSMPGHKCLGQAPTVPSPTDLGWIKTSGMYKPLWTTLPVASKICRELMSLVYNARRAA